MSRRGRGGAPSQAGARRLISQTTLGGTPGSRGSGAPDGAAGLQHDLPVRPWSIRTRYAHSWGGWTEWI